MANIAHPSELRRFDVVAQKNGFRGVFRHSPNAIREQSRLDREPTAQRNTRGANPGFIHSGMNCQNLGRRECGLQLNCPRGVLAKSESKGGNLLLVHAAGRAPRHVAGIDLLDRSGDESRFGQPHGDGFLVTLAVNDQVSQGVPAVPGTTDDARAACTVFTFSSHTGWQTEYDRHLIARIEDFDNMRFDGNAAFQFEPLDDPVPELFLDRAPLSRRRLADTPILKSQGCCPSRDNFFLKLAKLFLA